MPKIVNYDERRNEIACAGIEIFFEKGYHKTRLNDVAKRVNIGRTTFYQYFNDKEDLFAFCIEKMMNKATKRQEDLAQNTEGNYAQKIHAMLECMISVEYYMKMKTLLHEYFSTKEDDTPKMIPILMQYRRKVIETYASVIEEGMNAGEFKRADVMPIAHTIYAISEANILPKLSGEDEFVERFMDAADLIVQGLKR